MYHLLKRSSFSHCVFLASLSGIVGFLCMDLFLALYCVSLFYVSVFMLKHSILLTIAL
jgi:hypothetical protein